MPPCLEMGPPSQLTEARRTEARQTDYWTCKDGFQGGCDGGPMLPGMVVYLEHLGSAVVDVDPVAGTADVVFLDATTGQIGDRYRITR